MFRYVLTILLINSCYRSLGLPVPSSPKPVSALLKELSDRCENQFLNKQIKSAIDQCPQDPRKEFKCLLFYDMANRLCLATNTSQITLKEDYVAEINKEQTLDNVCSEAKNWVLSKFTDYKLYSSKILQVGCSDVCGVDVWTNLDVNFYCKFYKWGDELLKTQPHVVANPGHESIIKTISEPKQNDSLDIIVSAGTNEKPKDKAIQSPEGSSSPINASSKLPPLNEQETLKQAKSNKDQELKSDVLPELKPNVPQNVIPNASSDKQPQVVKQVPFIAPVAEKIEKHEEPKSNSVIENPNINPQEDIDDYPGNDDSEIPKNDPDAADEDNVEDPGFEDDKQQKEKKDDKINAKVVPVISNPNDPPQKASKEENEQFEENKQDNIKVEPAMPSFREVKHTEFYPSTIQDGYPDDDHFFTFFLTAVILVVVIYVLYYNKSRVGKLVLGLIVEGRQGRRRNSRGHAYRRLDTLEQAMSSNTTAPPSKIIY
ncbi:circumsporozoite protein-like [Bombyx mandarina]|uniref:Circumsporozoite protein-like n=1 Tax=Bombyx mandarina TaxID=7092 RepID=A0A6J2JG06_BOMMA|nr:circumsporozoite protein-like [Bombyx mandarina]